jgi:hypothetical protein
MPEPPKIRQLLASSEEMEALFIENRVEEKLPNCRREAVEQQKTQGVVVHEAFCCKKESFRFFDPVTDDEVALITWYTKLDNSKQRVISRLRIGEEIYELKLL